MASLKTLALVLRVVEFSETSCIVTLYTEDFGKIGALAKGARRPKSPFESALDLLARCRIVFLQKSSDALDLLTEAKLERRFRAATRDLSRLYAGYYVAELLDALTDKGDPHPELFRTAGQALDAIDGSENVAGSLLRWEVSALRLLGHLPTLEICAGCGREVEDTARVAFGQLSGGVLCRSCRIGQRQVVSVSKPVIETLRIFARPEWDGWTTTILEPKLHGELRGVLNHYLANLLGRRPKLYKFLSSLSLGGQNNSP